MGAICSRSIYVFLLLFTIHFANLEAQCDRARDSLVLVDIFESNPQSQALLNWDLSGSPIDEWTGIRLNAEGCIQELDLINKSIDTLPQTIGLLQSLNLFRLRDNQIAYLPEGIFDLERLSFLGLNNNTLVELPQNISSKSGLQNFEIANNELTILPDSIVNLKKLNWLIAHGNNLTSLPTTIGQLSNLFLLSLDNNSLSSLPDEIGQLGNLITLSLISNNISALPESIGDISSLQILSLSDNKLIELPDRIGQLGNLKGLSIDHNNLISLPESIGNLNKLEALTASENNIRELPKSIGNLTSVINLELNDNKLTELPETIGNLKKLWRLFLFRNKLESLPESFGGMDSLEWLVIDNNRLTSIPQSIGNLNNLETLEARYNRLNTLPESIGDLQNLKYMRLGYNEIESLPERIGDLNNLITLYCDYNNLFELPASIGSLQNLEYLSLRFNLIEELPQTLNDLDSLEVLLLDGNKLTFEDLYNIQELLPGLIKGWYFNQAMVYKDTLLYFKKGERSVIDLQVDENISNNTYRWVKGRFHVIPDPGNNENVNKLIIQSPDLDDVGIYRASISNEDFPDTDLITHNISVRVCDRQNDSLELIRLYDSTSGPSWSNSTNWLQSNVSINNWYGITTDQNGCVNKIDLSNNKLVGNIPDLDLNTLDTLILRGNLIEGGIPSNLSVPFIKYIDLSNNSLTGSIPEVVGKWMLLSNMNFSNNFLRESIPPEIGDLCELEELQLEGNGFEGELPTELTMLTNLKKGQVSFADNVIDSLKQETIFFCPFGVEIMANNPGGFERFVEICGDTCAGAEFDQLSDFPWLIDTLQSLDCIGDACVANAVSSEAGFVHVRNVEVVYTKTRCFTMPDKWEEVTKFYDCGGYLLESVTCTPDSCFNNSIIAIEEYEALLFDTRWNCDCTSAQCIERDTVIIDAGEQDTLDVDEFVLYPDKCNTGLYKLYSANAELPGDPLVVTEDNIGFSYALVTENLISQAQCTTTIDVVRGSTGRRDFSREKRNAPVMITCQPNPVKDVLWCPEIDMYEMVEFRVFSLQGAAMPVQMGDQQDIFQLMVNQYPSGIYILQVRSRDSIYLNRFTVMQ